MLNVCSDKKFQQLVEMRKYFNDHRHRSEFLPANRTGPFTEWNDMTEPSYIKLLRENKAQN